MLMKRAQNAIKKELAQGHDIFLRVTSGRYKGSILQLEKIKRMNYWWEMNDKERFRFLLNADGLVRRLSVDPKFLSDTDEHETHLTAEPNITKKQKLPKDILNTVVDVDDYLFGKGALIQITSVSAHNHLEAKCIATTNKDIKITSLKTYRSLKKFLKLDDPAEIFSRMQAEKNSSDEYWSKHEKK